MSVRTHRTRLIAAAVITVATLTLTACNDGEGVRDEGASAGATSKSSSTGTGQADSANSAANSNSNSNSKASAGSASGSGSTGSTGSTGTSGTSGSKGSEGSSSASVACTGANTRTAATVVSRPLNHLLLTVTNTGSKNCDLPGYPAVRFGEAQSVPPVFEDSQPQAVVTLAPGESGYAGVLLAAADGSGSNGYTAKSLSVFFGESSSAARPSLPAKGVYVDDSIGVSYWQSTMDNALAW